MAAVSGAGSARDDDARVARARTRVADALAVAARGRYASAERMLRDALGVLERRQRYAGAARAAATLGRLLRERGQSARAGEALQQARLLFDTARGGTVDGPADTLAGGEQEDYRAAHALLRFPSVQPVQPDPSPPPEPNTGLLLDRAAGDVVDLVRAVETAAPGAAPARLCGVLREQLEAQAVAVYGLGPPPAQVAADGEADRRLPDGLRPAAEAGRVVPLAAAGRRSHTAVPIRCGAAPAGALVVCWARPPAKLDRPVAVARVAAALLETDFRERSAAMPDAADAGDFHGLLGRSAEMSALRAAIARAAEAPYPVLIEGETGTGKELAARALHRLGPRRTQAFCAVNCAALTDDLFEAELFGHSRGAFTGAVTERAGLVEAADGGTLFLDEVGELSARAQAKLLRVVQEGEIRRVGENAVRRVDVRLLAATNRNLAAEAAAGRFRQDLLFRLAVVCLPIPPLRERAGDVELLVRHFWARELVRAGKRATLGASALAALRRYRWPGNVRELQNVTARMVVAAPRRGAVGLEALPAAIRGCADSVPETLADARLAFERRFVRSALARNGGRPGAAARELGLSRQGLAKLIKRLALDGPEAPAPQAVQGRLQSLDIDRRAGDEDEQATT